MTAADHSYPSGGSAAGRMGAARTPRAATTEDRRQAKNRPGSSSMKKQNAIKQAARNRQARIDAEPLGVPPTTDRTPKYAAQSREDYEFSRMIEAGERCGGGRRIIRKQIGGD